MSLNFYEYLCMVLYSLFSIQNIHFVRFHKLPLSGLSLSCKFCHLFHKPVIQFICRVYHRCTNSIDMTLWENVCRFKDDHVYKELLNVFKARVLCSYSDLKTCRFIMYIYIIQKKENQYRIHIDQSYFSWNLASISITCTTFYCSCI